MAPAELAELQAQPHPTPPPSPGRGLLQQMAEQRRGQPPERPLPSSRG